MDSHCRTGKRVGEDIHQGESGLRSDVLSEYYYFFGSALTSLILLKRFDGLMKLSWADAGYIPANIFYHTSIVLCDLNDGC